MVSKIKELAGDIIDEFEALLDEKGIKIPSKERDEYEAEDTEKANIFGSDYYLLEDNITSMIIKFIQNAVDELKKTDTGELEE